MDAQPLPTGIDSHEYDRLLVKDNGGSRNYKVSGPCQGFVAGTIITSVLMLSMPGRFLMESQRSQRRSQRAQHHHRGPRPPPPPQPVIVPVNGSIVNDMTEWDAWGAEKCGPEGGFDDDTSLTPETCGPPDYNDYCKMLCGEGTACYDVCGAACESEDMSWGSVCVLSIFANLAEACDGNYVPGGPPGPPPGALAPPSTTKVIYQDRNFFLDCGVHAMCTVCNSMKNVGCRIAFQLGEEHVEAEDPPPIDKTLARWASVPKMLEADAFAAACARYADLDL